ncbi:6-bladed beta-propeller protein [Breznakibacter xylanolyticus]|uniref:6-bladed beta-propeller protein n=1 Tax=Breznakibacter xylanolyticus TaxID=990 RepID=A0A2W7MZY5_9BACT|nr:6-bladed beta-propeller protein [Breznakibacter xylanolyticus]
MIKKTIVIGLIVYTACHPSHQRIDTPTTLVNIHASRQMDASELFTNRQYIPLETCDSCLLGEINKLLI